MTYRRLLSSEWPAIEHEFLARQTTLPNESLGMIFGAFRDDGSFAGFLVLQLQFHMEPLVLYDPTALRGLVHCAENELESLVGSASYFALAPDSQIAGLCEAMGLQPVEMQLFSKRVGA